MLLKLKSIYTNIFKVILALAVISFMVLVFFTLASKQLNHNTQVLTFISLVTVLLSMPSIIDSLAKEVNPKKKVYKLTCACPHCQQVVEMDMSEEE